VFIFSLPFELQKTVRALPQVHGVEGGRKLSQLMREKIPGAIVLFQNTPFGSSTIQKMKKSMWGSPCRY
jgi:hypothetical protein